MELINQINTKQTKSLSANKSNKAPKEVFVSQEILALVAVDTIAKPSLEALAFAAVLDSILSASHVVAAPDISYSAQDSMAFFNPSTDSLKSRLSLLDQGTILDSRYNPSLEGVIKMYLRSKRVLIQKMLHRSAYYFPLFERELDALSMPMEIKYLAIVESALNPKARSRVGATGLWQFMYGTGKMMGLEVNNYVDERQDPLKSTQAACAYLKDLHKSFGSWDLALAAYNSGPGNVTKAIRRSGGYQNYWNIRNHLPRETAGYLPAFLATMYIFEYAEEHGFTKPKPEVALFDTDTIRVKRMITLDQVSEATGVEIEELQFLNPSYKLDIIPYIKDENYTLRLPRNVIGPFVNNEDQIYAYAKAEFDKREKPLPQFFEAESKTIYRVRSGDFLGKEESKLCLNELKYLWPGR